MHVTDRNVESYWKIHETELKQIRDVPAITATTAPPIFKSLEDDRSIRGIRLHDLRPVTAPGTS
jgi:hypothetical protein